MNVQYFFNTVRSIRRTAGLTNKYHSRSAITGNSFVLGQRTFPLFSTCQNNQVHSCICTNSRRNSDYITTWQDLRTQSKPSFSSKLNVLQLDEVVELIQEEGGIDVVVIKVPEALCYVEYFIIATANSSRHLFSITEIINKLYKKKKKDDQPFAVIEGKRQSDDWHCIDMGNMVVHVMLSKTRSVYNLETLWLLGPKYDEELLKVPSSEEILKQLSMQGLNLMSMTEDTVRALGNIDIDNPWLNDASTSPQKNEDKESDGKVSDLEDDDAFLV